MATRFPGHDLQSIVSQNPTGQYCLETTSNSFVVEILNRGAALSDAVIQLTTGDPDVACLAESSVNAGTIPA